MQNYNYGHSGTGQFYGGNFATDPNNGNRQQSGFSQSDTYLSEGIRWPNYLRSTIQS